MDEPDADGHVLLRPRVPFRTRQAALEQMAAVVREAPSVTRPVEELRWVGERRGSDYWQTPEETEQLGTGDCEDLEMYAARQDLDAGVPDVQLCMSVTGRRNEHVFGARGGQVVDHSEAAGMSPLPPSVYLRRVCVPVLREEGERTMIMGSEAETGGPGEHEASHPGEFETAGPSDAFDDYNIHGIAHWNSRAWDRAAATAAQRFPRARPAYQRVVPGLKSAAAYFSTLRLSAWDHAGNEARVRKVKDAIWVNKRSEELARSAYRNDGGDDAAFVLEFERRYGRPPTDRESVRAAVRALIYIATAKTHPGYQQRLSRLMARQPATLTQAAIQVALVAQGLVNPTSYPVPPQCPDCAAHGSAHGSRPHAQQHGPRRPPPRVVEPDEINLNIVYNPSTTTTTTTASAPGAVATTQTNTGSGSAGVTAPISATTGYQPIAAGPLPIAAGPLPIAAAPSPIATGPLPPLPLPPGGSPFGGFGGPSAPASAIAPQDMLTSMFGGNPFAAALAPPPAPAAVTQPGFTRAPTGGGPTSISNSGNVTFTFVGDDGGEALADDGTGGAGGTVDNSTMGDLETVMGMMMGGSAGMLGLTTGGPEEFATGGDDDDGLVVVTGGDDGEFATGGDDEDELATGGGDDDDGLVVVTGGDEDELATGGDEVVSGGWEEGEAGLDLLLDDDGDGESFIEIEPAPCSTGTCGLF